MQRFPPELFRPIWSILPLSPPDTGEPEVVEACAFCSDFFNSEAIGDLTNWCVLSHAILHEWEMISMEWKGLLAAEVLKVDRVDDQRVG